MLRIGGNPVKAIAAGTLAEIIFLKEPGDFRSALLSYSGPSLTAAPLLLNMTP